MGNKPTDQPGKLVIFQSKKIRRTWHEDAWYYSVVDIIGALTDSSNPRDYWYRMKKRVDDEEKIELSTICRQLKLDSSDGKKYQTDCVNTKGAFRLIQSIPSKKAEPFKRWLAQVGQERLDEIENPELAQEQSRREAERSRTIRKFVQNLLFVDSYQLCCYNALRFIYKPIWQ